MGGKRQPRCKNKVKRKPEKRAKRAAQAILHGQCLRKVRHKDRATAKAAMKALAVQEPGLGVYKCPHCGFFHVGNK